MKYLLFTLILISSISLTVPAFADSVRSETTLTTDNPDGSITKTIGMQPFILNPTSTNFEAFIFTDNTNQKIVETNHGSVKLDDSCTFEFYNNGLIRVPVYSGDGETILYYTNEFPLFTDSIIPLMANEGTMDYTIIDSINDADCSISWNGSELTASKFKVNVGLMEYKYILNNGSWKTQLEVTNFSDITNKQFGFTQTINLNSDFIIYGGSQRNLDDLDGQTFGRAWLENNESKVINLLNGFNFDFDLSFDNLNQVNIFDDGANKSKLSFDYVYNQNVILPGETLIIDPNFGDITTTDDGRNWSNNPSSGTCIGRTVTGGDTSTGQEYGSTGYCDIAFWDFDLSELPDNADPTAATFGYDSTSGGFVACTVREITNNPTTNDQTTYDNSLSGTALSASDTECATTGAGRTVPFNAAGLTAIKNNLTGDDTLAISYFVTSPTTPTGAAHQITANSGTLSITYNISPDPPKQAGGSEFSTTQIDLTWLAGELNGDTHSNFEVERLNLDGTTWDELVSQSAVDYSDIAPVVNATAMYRIIDTGALGSGCPQFVMNSTIVSNLQSHFPYCFTTNDSGILDNDGTVTGNELFTNSSGIIYRDYDGSSYDVIPVESDYDRIPTDPFSISFKIKKPNASAVQVIFAKANGVGGEAGFNAFVKASDDIRFSFGNGATAWLVDSTTLFNDDIEHHVVLTKGTTANQNNMKIYVDGVLEGTGASSAITGTITNNLSLTIGAESDGDNKLTGKIKDFEYFDIELTAHDVENLYLERIDTSSIISLEPTFDPVTDLTATATGQNTIDLEWTVPTSNGADFLTHMVNFTTPFGIAETFYINTTSISITANSLTALTDYSWQVGTFSLNQTVNWAGNIANATTLAFNPPGTPTLGAIALSDTALRFTSIPGVAGHNATIWYGLQCELNNVGGWLSTITNSSYVSFYEYTGLTVGDSLTCQQKDGSVDGWSSWSNNATDILQLLVIQSARTAVEDPLKSFENFIETQGGLYFGLGLFPFVTMLFGFMAGKKTVRIFTLITLFIMGILHASGYYVYPDWYWTLSLLLGLVLVLGRQKSD